MKKTTWVLLGVVVILAIAGATWVYMQPDSKTPKTESSMNGHDMSQMKIVEACDILTDEVAAKVIGEGATKASDPATKSADVSVSSCNYSTTKTGVSLLARSALSEAGHKSNQSQFDGKKESSAEVEGLGDAAYWDENLGQLNILKNGAWYILQTGSVKVSERMLPDTETYARLIVDKL